MNLLKDLYKAAKFRKSLSSLNDEAKEEQALAYLSELMHAEKGLFLKVGQFLGAKDRYQALSDGVYKYHQIADLDELKKTFQKIFNQKFEDFFVLSSEDSPSASLSQIFYIKEKATGKMWVLKSLLPGIKEKLRDQLNSLGLIPNIGPQKKWGVDIGLYKNLISNMIEHELDYSKETKDMDHFSSVFSTHKFIKVPKVHSGYCSQEMYVQEFIKGKDLSEVLKKIETYSPEKRKQISLNLVDFYIKSFFFANKIQSDGNLGNFRVHFTADGELELGVLDLGAVYSFDEKFVVACLALLRACKENQDIDLVEVMVDLGFEEDKLLHIEEHLASLLKIFLEPFVSINPYNFSDWKLEERMEALLGEHRWWFRSAGGEAFFVLMKSLNCLISIMEKLEIKLALYPLIEKNSLNQLLKVTERVYPPAVKRDHIGFHLLAKEIEILVIEDGQQKVKLHLPIKAIYNLEDYMDEDLKEKLNQKAVDYKQVIKDFIASSGAPRELFSLSEEHKSFRISAI